MHKVPHLWPGVPVSGIRLISWPADVPAFSTSILNSPKYHSRETFLKISLRELLGSHMYITQWPADQRNKSQERSFRKYTGPTTNLLGLLT